MGKSPKMMGYFISAVASAVAAVVVMTLSEDILTVHRVLSTMNHLELNLMQSLMIWVRTQMRRDILTAHAVDMRTVR